MARALSVLGSLADRRLLAALVVAGSVAFLAWPTGGSATEQARNEIHSLFVNVINPARQAHVNACDQIGANREARIYLCEIETAGCTHLFRFAVDRGSTFGVTPVSASIFTLRHPCRPYHS